MCSTCRTTLRIFKMILAFYAFVILGMLIIKPSPCTTEVQCKNGHLCPAHWNCCDLGCCDGNETALPPAPSAPSAPPASSSPPAPAAPPRRVVTLPPPVLAPPFRDSDEPHLKDYNWHTSWMSEWPVLFVLGTLGGICFCCVWCVLFKREPDHSEGVYMCSFSCCLRRPTSDLDSAGSVYPPPRYSRCGSFHQAPPPYSEVASKPDLYPLVITCGETGDGKAGNYLMVHYFRNYVIRAPGSISATSTAESLNSSFICNAANEANSVVPPPYSCANNYGDCGVGCGPLLRSLSSLTEARSAPAPQRSRTDPTPSRPREPPAAFRDNLITSPVQPSDTNFDLEMELIDCEMYCDGGCKPRLGASPPVHETVEEDDDDNMYMHEAYGSLRQFYTGKPDPPSPTSPPQPTSPTQTSRDSTLRRASEERRKRLDSVKKTPRQRKTSLYMPLSVAYPVRTSRISPGTRTSSRSAPATPCGSLVPSLLTFSQRLSASRHGSKSSKFEEENDPLLADLENGRTDHKF